MTSILIVSDNHGNIESLEILKERYQNKLMFHLGDIELNDFEIKNYNMELVRGNSYYDPDVAYDKVVNLENKSIFLTHGHMYLIKSSTDNIIFKAKTLGVDIVVHGHTHIPNLKVIDNILLLCPGSLSRNYGSNPGSYIELIIDDNHVKALLKNLKTAEVIEWIQI